MQKLWVNAKYASSLSVELSKRISSLEGTTALIDPLYFLRIRLNSV